jgi:NDP-sugar pyrophosphorylase family protein
MAVMGHHCNIAEGAVIEDSVIWNEVIVGLGAHIKNSIVGHGATIGPGTRSEMMMVCRDQSKEIG